MKKKIIAIGLITTMVVSNSMMAWADTTITDNNGTDTHDVNGKYELSDSLKDLNNDGIPDVDEDNNNVADDTLDEGNDGTITTPAGATYSVDITWGNMNFIYRAGATSWDDEAHVYTEETDGAWEPETENVSNKITVKNNSNVGILATVSYANDGGVYAAVNGHIYDASKGGNPVKGTRSYQGTVEYVNDAIDIPNAVLNTGGALEKVAYLQLIGAPTSSWNTNKKMGAVTVTVNYNLN